MRHRPEYIRTHNGTEPVPVSMPDDYTAPRSSAFLDKVATTAKVGLAAGAVVTAASQVTPADLERTQTASQVPRYTKPAPGTVIPFGHLAELDADEISDLTSMTPVEFADAHPEDARMLSHIGQVVLNDTRFDDSFGNSAMRFSGDRPGSLGRPGALGAAILELARQDSPSTYDAEDMRATRVLDMTQPDADGVIGMTVTAALQQPPSRDIQH